MNMAQSHAVKEAPRRFTVRGRDGEIVGKADLRTVPVSAIKVDHEYQRDVSSHWVHEHLPYDPRKAGAIVLSGRLGGPWCLDGQHRVELARADGVSHVNAYVIEGLTKADEAGLFVQYQRERRNLTSFSLFRAEVVAGNPETLALVRIVNRAGFHLAKTAGPHNITAIDAIRYVHRYGGDELLTRTLDLVKQDSWFQEEKGLSGQVLKGIALFLASAGQQPAFRRERLERVMRSTAPVRLLRLSQTIAEKRRAFTVNAASNVAEALKEQYDKLVPQGEEKLGPLTIGNKRRPRAKGSAS